MERGPRFIRFPHRQVRKARRVSAQDWLGTSHLANPRSPADLTQHSRAHRKRHCHPRVAYHVLMSDWSFVGAKPRRLELERVPHWGHRFSESGHEIRIVPAQFVKPYLKSNKNNFNDAEAASRPEMLETESPAEAAGSILD